MLLRRFRTAKTITPSSPSPITVAGWSTPPTPSTACRKTISSAPQKWTRCSRFDAHAQFQFEGETRRQRVSVEGSVNSTTRGERGSQRSIADEVKLGQIVAAFGRQYLVRMDDGREIACLTRGKKSEVACGDVVEIQRTADASAGNGTGAQGVIERIAPRRSLLHRSDAFREKLIAGNVTQIIVVVAAEPSFSDELLARCLVAAFDQKLEVLIVLNKCELFDAAAAARKRLIPYRDIGYRVLELSAKQDVSV